MQKERKCPMCGKLFLSTHAGHRRCEACRKLEPTILEPITFPNPARIIKSTRGLEQ